MLLHVIKESTRTPSSCHQPHPPPPRRGRACPARHLIITSLLSQPRRGGIHPSRIPNAIAHPTVHLHNTAITPTLPGGYGIRPYGCRGRRPRRPANAVSCRNAPAGGCKHPPLQLVVNTQQIPNMHLAQKSLSKFVEKIKNNP